MPQPYDYATPFNQAASMPTPDAGAALLQGIQQGIQQQFGMAQMRRELALQAQADQVRQATLANPTPDNIVKLGIADPQHWEAINASHTQKNQDQQRQDVQDAAAVYGSLQSGDADGAAAIVQRRVNAGQNNLEPLLQAIKTNPKGAQAAAGLMLAGMMGPDKFAEVYGATSPQELALKQAQTAQATAQAAEANAQAGQIANPRPKTAVAGIDPNTGQPIYYNENAAPPGGNGAPAQTATPDIQSFAAKIQADENSTGNPGAKNPNSTATGNGQFIKSTWLSTVKKYRPDLAQGKTDDQILAMRSDPQLSTEMTTHLAQDNAQTLGSMGVPVNGTTLAMAHKLSPQMTQAVLSADPNAPLKSILPAGVIAANPQLAKLTAGQYAQGLAKKFGVDPIAADASQASALTGDDYLKTLPPARANVIRAIADGRLAPPSPGSRAPGAQQLLQQVAQYDPTFDAANAKTRQATRLSFTSGKDAANITALNTAIGHLGELDGAIDGLGNYGLPLNNAIAHGIAAATGTDARVKKFELTKEAALAEVNKVFVGSAGALADREAWKKQLDAAGNPDALHAVVAQMADLLRSRIDALGEKYNQGLGKSVDGLTLLSPTAQRTFLTLGKTQAQRQASAPPTQSIIALRQNPQLASYFDEKYGKGAANAYLGHQELAQ